MIQDDFFKAGSISRKVHNAPHCVTENACNMIDDMGYGPYFVKTRKLQIPPSAGVRHTRLYEAVRQAENWISETNQHCDVTDKDGADRYSTDKGLIAPGKTKLVKEGSAYIGTGFLSKVTE